MTRWIGITLGDVTGIGPEVTLKALAAEPANDGTQYLLIGDEGYLHRLNEKLGTGLPLEKFSSYQAGAGSLPPGRSPSHCRKICRPVRRPPPMPPSPRSRMAPNAVSVVSWMPW